ncbi:unnamed protein product [Litomosoides sigmodontis]|uniref:Pyrroline-5-carboxylate reductase n=1 Tax=Litomosoides sigmodontis TaxID=42156 RepID=A0A3P6UBF4_LITSI|nr:unnamed protein product [Litomosoides sigmodontis]
MFVFKSCHSIPLPINETTKEAGPHTKFPECQEGALPQKTRDTSRAIYVRCFCLAPIRNSCNIGPRRNVGGSAVEDFKDLNMSFTSDENCGSAENGCTKLRKILECTSWKPKLAFIGGGKMAAALIRGFESAGLVTKNEIAVSVKTVASAGRWKQLGYANVYTSNELLVRAHGQGIVFLSVKPEARMAMYAELNRTAFSNTPVIISIMNGVDVKTLEKELAANGYTERGVVRLIPNLPVSVCSGASIMCFSACLKEENIELIKCIMQYVGICAVVSEKSFDAAAAVAGCGPAFIFIAIEALSDGGVLGGLDRATAIKLSAHTVMGTARMLLEANEHPGVLKDDVCSAGGSTIYGVKELEKSGFRSALIEAVYASAKRSAGQM